MSVRPEKSGGLLQPKAGVAVAQPRMVRHSLGIPAQIVHSGLQGVDEVGEWGVRRGFARVLAQPAAGAAKAAIYAAVVCRFESTLQMAVGEIHLAVDEPARIRQQRRCIPRKGPRLSTVQCGHSTSKVCLIAA